MDFQDYQRSFCAHIRDPKARPRPKGAAAKRMRVYSDLLYRNIEGFLLACFPVCRQVLGIRRWTRLVRAFIRDHACHTPYFRQIPEEFLRYLQDDWEPAADFPDFLPELAHYEWVELDLETSAIDAPLPAHRRDGDLLKGRPLLNPVMRLLAYRYPVQRISPRYKPDRPPAEPTFIVACRDAGLSVRFTAINALTAQLLSRLQEDAGLSGQQALTELSAALPGQAPGAFLAAGAALLEDLRRQGVIVGVRA